MSTEVTEFPSVLRGRTGVVLRLALPLAAVVGLIASVLVVFPYRGAEFYGLVVTYMVPPAGKETVIPAAVAAGFSPFLVATYIAGIDMTVGWLMAWNWDFITGIPLVGELVERLMERGQAWMEEQPIVDRSAFLGLILFVFFPMQGSGAVAGITLGRLVGMPAQRAWLAIMLGALTASFAWAYAAGAIRAAVFVFGLDVVLRASLVLIASAVFAVLLTRRIHR
ncbi:hypothetical protein BRD56_00475 [Thermoplasmatales archaeon SW_10_69_26]|nr:MAG: hypothetical protein BRD56_00475 [Thermoplasmatales archaeon SW_10_69_26]